MTWTLQMILKNIAILFLGVALGMTIITVFYGYMFHRIKKVANLKDISAMKLKCGETTHFFINPDTTQESVESLLLLIYMYFHTGKHISAKDAKRTKRVIYSVFIIFFITIIILIILSFNVSLPPVT